MRAALAAAILLFVPGLLDPFNGPKAVVLRLVGLPLLVLAAGRWLAGRRKTRDFDDPTPDVVRAIDLLVGAWVVVAILATVFGISPRLSWAGEIGQREGLLTTLALAGLYAGARRSHSTVGHVRGTLLVVLACAVLAAVYGLAQRAGLDPLRWDAARYPSGAGSVMRAFGTSGNAIFLGALLAAALGIGIVLASERGRSGWLTWSLALLGAALAATLSRSAFLGAGAGAVVALAAVFRVEGGRPDRGRLLAIGAALALAIAWSLVSLRGPMTARLAESADPHAESAPARVEMARAVFVLTTRRPLLGVGPDAFGLAFPAAQSARYWRNAWLGDPAHAHSTALQVLATLGFLGALVGLAWILTLALALRPRRAEGEELLAREIPRAALFAGLAALLVAGLFNPVGLAGAALFVVLAAMPAALVPARLAAVRAAARVPAPAIVLAGLVALAVLVSAAGEFRASAAARRAQGALLRELELPPERRPPAARFAGEWAARAAAAAPGEDELWRLRCDAALAGVATTRRGPVRDSLAADALASARNAVVIEPHRGSNFDRLANAFSAEERWSSADSAFAAASARAPVDPFIRLDRHRSEMARGRPDLALRTARELVALYPEESTSHAAEAAAWLGLGRRPEAIGALKRALAARWEVGSDDRQEAARRWLRALEGDSLAGKSRK